MTTKKVHFEMDDGRIRCAKHHPTSLQVQRTKDHDKVTCVSCQQLEVLPHLREEIKLLRKLAGQVTRFSLTAVVDDDFPTVRDQMHLAFNRCEKFGGDYRRYLNPEDVGR